MNYTAAGERLLEVAARLFYAEGVSAIGVDRVAAEAGIPRLSVHERRRRAHRSRPSGSRGDRRLQDLDASAAR